MLASDLEVQGNKAKLAASAGMEVVLECLRARPSDLEAQRLGLKVDWTTYKLRPRRTLLIEQKASLAIRNS